MSVPFTALPPNIRVPGAYSEVDSSKAVRGPQVKPWKVLLVGMRLSTGNVAEKVKKPIRNADQARAFFGAGSQLHGMAMAYFNQRLRIDDVDAIAIDESGGGTAATLTLTVTVTSAKTGTIYLYIAGRRILVPVANGDAQNAIASAIRTAVNATDGVQVVASGSTNSVVLTAAQKGLEGNATDVRVGYNTGEDLPLGVSISNVPGVLSGGTGNPTIDAALITAIGEVQYDMIAIGLSDVTNLGVLETEMQRRFEPLADIQGNYVFGKRDTQVNLVTFTNALNSKFGITAGAKGMLNPPWEWAAGAAARAAYELQADPGRPLQTVEIDYLLAPAQADQFTRGERQLLYLDDCSAFVQNANGKVTFDRFITLYQVSAAGAPDTAFMDVTTMATLSYLRWDLKRRILTKFPRHKLAMDGTRFGAGQPIVTPGSVKGELVSWFRDWEELGLVEDVEQFKRDLIVEQNASDPTRLDVILPPNLVNGLVVFANLLQFRL